MIIVRSDHPVQPFTQDGDSGALVTGIGMDDQVAYALHMSIDRGHEYMGDKFDASVMCRLDTSLQLLAHECELNLDFVRTRPSLLNQLC